jgi:hypothetical protein
MDDVEAKRAPNAQYMRDYRKRKRFPTSIIEVTQQ